MSASVLVIMHFPLAVPGVALFQIPGCSEYRNLLVSLPQNSLKLPFAQRGITDVTFQEKSGHFEINAKYPVFRARPKAILQTTVFPLIGTELL